MDKNEPDLVEQLHREAVEHRRAEEERGRLLAATMHAEALEDQRRQQRKADEVIDRMHRAAVESRQQLPPPPESPTVHYSELPEAKPDSPLYREWETYRREVARLLTEGDAGRHILIKDAQIIGIWDTHDEAMAAGCHRFLGQPFLVHQIQERERVLRCVTVRRCRNSYSPSHPA